MRYFVQLELPLQQKANEANYSDSLHRMEQSNKELDHNQVAPCHFNISKRRRMHQRRVSSNMALLRPSGTQGQADQPGKQVKGQDVQFHDDHACQM